VKLRYLVFALIAINFPLFASPGAQPSAFKLSFPVDLSLGAAGVGIWIPSLIVDRGPSGGNWKINSFDKALMTKYYHAGLDKASDWAVGLLSASPVLFTLPLFTAKDKAERKTIGYNLLTYAAMYAEAALLVQGSKDLLKGLIPRNRPYTYGNGAWPSGSSKDYYNSFPSGHTSFGFMEAGLISAIMTFDYPDSPWKWPVIIASYAAASGIAVMRAKAGMHFATDLVAGAALGSLYGWGIPLLHLVF
jgi:membrane-associated phospholipid phosphatase